MNTINRQPVSIVDPHVGTMIQVDKNGRIIYADIAKDLHEKYPALKNSWDQYQIVLRMCLAQEATEGWTEHFRYNLTWLEI